MVGDIAGSLTDSFITPSGEGEDQLSPAPGSKLAVQKQLLEEMAAKGHEKEKTNSPAPTNGTQDSVFISQGGMEISQSQSVNMEISQGRSANAATATNAGERTTIRYEMELYQRQSVSAEITNSEGERTTIRLESEQSMRVTMQQTEVREPAPEVRAQEPLVFDLDGDGVELTDVTRNEGVNFDINGDGIKENVSWVQPDDGLLAIDKNNNGTIDNGKELFGDQNGAVNGFEELSRYDDDNNGIINKQDSAFSNLYMWQDMNRNGISEQNELKGLDDYGITSISLLPDHTRDYIAGNLVDGYGEYETASGKGSIGEVYLNYLA